MKDLSGSKLMIIAAVCGILAAVLTVFYLKLVENKYKKAAEPKHRTEIAVVVANQNLQKGQVLTQQLIAARKVPEIFLPSNAILATEYQKVINRTLLMPAQKGRPLTWEAITGKSAKTFSENIELGRRARSIKVSKIDSFDGLLRPGDRIDLMGNFTLSTLGLTEAVNDAAATQTSEDIVMPVLENVEVLSAGREDLAGRRYEKSPSRNSVDGFNMEFTVINLNLTQKQIARLELAQQSGSIFAVLRHPKDTSMAEYQYAGIELLLQEQGEETIDIVVDASGMPIGRIVGDNIVDFNGKIIGKVINGKAVGFDGKPLGQIIRNVAPNDPILRVKETADIVRDKNGNILGKIVNGQLIDKNGKVIGEVRDGKVVGMDGEELGKIERNVALDANGNVVNMKDSNATINSTHRQKVVRDRDGNIIGNVINGEIVDSSGKVIGKLDKNGNPISHDGKSLGTTAEVMVDRSGKVVASEEQVVRDADGNIIGRVVNGKVVDDSGKVIGTVEGSGKVRSLSGEELGKVETVMLDESGAVVGGVAEVIRDKNGNIVGRIENGKVIDKDGNVIGKVGSDGRAAGLDGKQLGHVEKVVTNADGQIVDSMVEVVRDKDGNIIGHVVDGYVVDANGNQIGTIKDGKLVDGNGNVLADQIAVTAESPVAVDAELRARESDKIVRSVEFVDFISGGTGKDGIVPVVRVRLE